MKVSEAIEQLGKFDPDAALFITTGHPRFTGEVDYVPFRLNEYQLSGNDVPGFFHCRWF